MGNIFCASEIIQMGIEIKNIDRNFYTKIGKSTRAKKVKEIFDWLAGEEEKQIKIFTDILANIEKCEPYEVYPGEYSIYLQALIDNHALGKERKRKKRPKEVKNNEEAISLALDFEKDTILLYHEMIKIVRKKERKIIEDVIKEEQKHLTKLMKLKECLATSELKACLITR